ncbi:ATP-dependent nuclease [Parasediminibacterium sp. JCM 36343]|uniref:ATP-dependent nuclease n=1 Tax=Parasediminibacterium sp. JCM 36343 TaxID=3374279 RepID=UPI0039780C3D
MAKIHSLSIKNFRGIKQFEQHFNSEFVCLIGRGDSGKSTVLEAIAYALSSSWNVSFFDNDFYNCNIENPISIEVTVKDLPDELMREDKFGLHLKGIGKDGKLTSEVEEIVEPAITIRLEVTKDLEPKWSVIADAEAGEKQISASDRSRLNAFFVSDYIDRHFSWSKGGPLYSLLRQETETGEDDDNAMIDALREAKTKIDGNSFSKFDNVAKKVKSSAAVFGIDISKSKTTIDFRDIVVKDGKVCLHDETVPFRMKGKGSRRLVSMAIQSAIAAAGGIMLIDEVEQGLEPDRVQSLVNTLKQNNHGQVFVTTHSRDVIVGLETDDIFLMKKSKHSLGTFDASLQGLLRKNPEAFFAKRVIVAEGATEMGICRALNDYRIANGKENISYLGIRIADGSGSETVSYCKGFARLGFPSALFCDSDSPGVNSQKGSLCELGISIFDWEGNDCLEMGIVRNLPFSLIADFLNLAAQIKHDDDPSRAIEGHKTSIWDSIKSHFVGTGFPIDLPSALDLPNLREAIGKAAHKGGWFKTQDKGYKLGMLVLDHLNEMAPESHLVKNLEDLSKWIDQNES